MRSHSVRIPPRLCRLLCLDTLLSHPLNLLVDPLVAPTVVGQRKEFSQNSINRSPLSTACRPNDSVRLTCRDRAFSCIQPVEQQGVDPMLDKSQVTGVPRVIPNMTWIEVHGSPCVPAHRPVICCDVARTPAQLGRFPRPRRPRQGPCRLLASSTASQMTSTTPRTHRVRRLVNLDASRRDSRCAR